MEPHKTIESNKENSEKKCEDRVREIIESVPQKELGNILADIDKYIEIRILSEDPKPETADEFIAQANDFEPWHIMQEQYGYTPEDPNTPKWSMEELKELRLKLKAEMEKIKGSRS